MAWKKWLRGLAAMAGGTLALVLAGWIYIGGYDLEQQPLADPATTAAQLDFPAQWPGASRGRILAVLTSTATFPGTDRKAGYELTELSRAYWVFRANGYEVDFASPRGGDAPMRLDDELVAADHAFLNDRDVRQRLRTTLPLAGIDPARYAAVYFVGGKGAMFDFVGNTDVQRLVRHHASRGVVGAVCHGPAALLGATREDGQAVVRGRRVAAFSNAEELFLMEDARQRFGGLLQDRLVAEGAQYSEGPMYLDHTVVDGRLVTGQNPWATWSVAEAMIRALGHEPLPRPESAEERAVRILATYHRHGWQAAKEVAAGQPGADRRLLLMHALVAAMQWRLGEALQLQALARP